MVLAAIALADGDPQGAETDFQRGLSEAQAVGDTVSSYNCLYWLGLVAQQQGDYDRSEHLLESSLQLMRAQGDRWGMMLCLRFLGRAAAARGEHSRAVARLLESLAAAREIGEAAGAAQCLDALAQVALAAGGPTRAARLLGAAEILRERSGSVVADPWHIRRTELDRTLAAARAALRETTFAVDFEAGRTLGIDAALSEALPVADLTPLVEGVA